MTDKYIQTAREIMEGRLPPTTTAVTARSWKEAQSIVGRSLGGSKETYIQHNILVGLVLHVAEALDKRTADKK